MRCEASANQVQNLRCALELEGREPGSRTNLVRSSGASQAQASGRFFATPGRRGKAGRSRAGLPHDEEPGRRLVELARDARRRPAQRGRGRRTAPPRESPPARANERGGTIRRRSAAGQAPSRPRHRPSRAPAPRRGPTRPGRSPGPSSRGTRTSAARPRAARPPVRAARARAGCRARLRRSPRRRSGRRIARRGARRRESPRAGPCAPPPRRRVPSGPALRAAPRARRQAGKTTMWRFGSVPSLSVATPSTSLSRSCTTLRSIAVIGSERHPLAGRDPLGGPDRDSLERHAAAVAVAGGVDRDRHRRAFAVEDRVRQVLQRVDRLAVPADQQAQIASGARDEELVLPLAARRPGRRSRARPPRARRARGRGARARSRRRAAAPGSRAAARAGDGSRRNHPRRRVADAEQAALALAHDLEGDARLVEPRRQPLELAQRLPLRLADGLAGRLDRDVGAHRREPPFLRLTRRGCCG